jgi:hypothetical protein
MSKESKSYGEYIPKGQTNSDTSNSKDQSSPAPMITANNITPLVSAGAEVVSKALDYASARENTKTAAIKASVEREGIQVRLHESLSNERIKQSEISQRDRESERSYRLEESKLKQSGEEFQLSLQKQQDEMQKFMQEKEFAKQAQAEKMEFERAQHNNEQERALLNEKHRERILDLLAEGKISEQGASDLLAALNK